MTLADRARQVAAAAPRHQSAEVLRECANVLDDWHDSYRQTMAEACDDKSGAKHCACVVFLRREVSAKDAEIARLHAELAALREAVGALPEYEHEGPGDGYGCPARHDRGVHCQCEAGRANAALAAARKLAGLG